MEVRVELDEALADELDEEAALQGFDDREAYLRWIIAHRPMSELASTQAPAVASRVSQLEERIKALERQLDIDQPADPEADLGGSSGPSLDAEADASGPSLDPDESSGGASLDVDASTESMDLAEPDDIGTDDPDEAEAGDDDIAEAIGDVEIEDEEEADEPEADDSLDDWE